MRQGVQEGEMDLKSPNGVLYPERLPEFHRLPAPDDLVSLVRWFWFPRWNLAPGQELRQELLPFPASNLVVQTEGVTISGPSTRRSERVLSGSGWAVGALLRPAAIVALKVAPVLIRDTEAPFAAPELHAEVVSAMQHRDHSAGREQATAAFAAWLRTHARLSDDAERSSEPGRLANEMEDLIANDRELLRVEHLAALLGVSMRRVQRLAQTCIGLPPLAVIRRYRLQEAAARLRDNDELTIAQLAAELGYADQAHLASDFRRILGITAHEYRRAGGPGALQRPS